LTRKSSNSRQDIIKTNFRCHHFDQHRPTAEVGLALEQTILLQSFEVWKLNVHQWLWNLQSLVNGLKDTFCIESIWMLFSTHYKAFSCMKNSQNCTICHKVMRLQSNVLNMVNSQWTQCLPFHTHHCLLVWKHFFVNLVRITSCCLLDILLR